MLSAVSSGRGVNARESVITSESTGPERRCKSSLELSTMRRESRSLAHKEGCLPNVWTKRRRYGRFWDERAKGRQRGPCSLLAYKASGLLS